MTKRKMKNMMKKKTRENISEKKPCHCQNNFKKFCKNDKGEKGEKCCGVNYACTLISVKNPQTVLHVPEYLTSQESHCHGEAVDLVEWTDIVPDALNSFDNATGTYTAYESGDYEIQLVVNYETNVPINVNPSLCDVPAIEIYDVCTGEHILASTFPAVCIIVPIPPPSTGDIPCDVYVSSLLCKAQVIISAVVPLCACQRIRVRAVTNGLTYIPSSLPPCFPLTSEINSYNTATIDFSPECLDTTLTIYKVRNSPIVKIDCNN